MPFPETDRVLYQRSPLRQVICQLRFPPVLRIGAESPANFQELIRKVYPSYRQNPAAPEVFGGVGTVFQFRPLPVQGSVHEFSDNESTWKVTLAVDFVALQTDSYNRWEEFSRRLEHVCETTKQCYGPTSYSRVGLRYIDVIQRSEIGLDGRPWSELLQPHIAGEFASPAVADDIQRAWRELLLGLPDGQSKVRIRHGLATAEPSPEQCFMIDSDFFRDSRTEIADADGILREFNRRAGHLFQWCIQPALQVALGPRPA